MDDFGAGYSVIAWGKRLGTMITAEGVATAEQFAHPRLQGRDDVEDYYFREPIAAGAARALVSPALASMRNPGTEAGITAA